MTWFLRSLNPYTQEENAVFPIFTDEEVDAAIGRAQRAFITWKTTPLEERARLCLRLADLLLERSDEYARLETQEMWRLYWVARQGMLWTVQLIQWFATHAYEYLQEEPITTEWLSWHMQYDPIGVIYGIAPWNFPFNQLVRAAIPNILAGNTQLYKHASNVPLCLQAIQDLFNDAGFPEWVFVQLRCMSSQSERIIAHPAVQGVNITWSEQAWSVIGALAGKYLKRSVLELWGNDAFVVVDYDRVEDIVEAAATCRLSNGGQRCNASKRFIIQERQYDQFVDAFGKYMAAQRVWDPMDPLTQVPPMSSASLLAEIDRQVQQTIQQWWRLVTWWRILDADRLLYAPTVIADVTPAMTSYQEEVFGPVASVIQAKDLDHAIALANHSDFGLSAVVYGHDEELCKSVARQLDWGMIFINQPAWSKASLPFGWVRKSGYGKENGPEWLRAFTNKKAIVYSIQ
jgi:succinate-semialdehyde dehydrogenase/glutarate-semialdehyde dehydrogenase